MNAHEVELRLIAAIVAALRDPAPRLVYADWLAARADPRGEFLRTQVQLWRALSEPGLHLRGALRRVRARLRAMARTLDPHWLARLDRAEVAFCPQWTLRCPMRWAELSPTAQPRVRHCEHCDALVFHVLSIEEAREHAHHGRCVALFSAIERSSGDLDVVEWLGEP